jgi:hypothetical protein
MGFAQSHEAATNGRGVPAATGGGFMSHPAQPSGTTERHIQVPHSQSPHAQAPCTEGRRNSRSKLLDLLCVVGSDHNVARTIKNLASSPNRVCHWLWAENCHWQSACESLQAIF